MINYNQALQYYLGNKPVYIQDINNQYILLEDFPDYFGRGYNSFLIGAKTDYFAPNTLLQVFLLDCNNKFVQVQITQYKQKQFVRCYVKVDSQIPVGIGNLFIIGILQNVPNKWKYKPNVIFRRHIYINCNEKTPSVLRFSHKPQIDISIDTKQLYQYNITTKEQNIPIEKIEYIKPGTYTNSLTGEIQYIKQPNMFKLYIDTSSLQSNSQSIYQQKFLNYKVTTQSLQLASENYKYIYSGSTDSNILYKGNYNGLLTGQKITLSYVNGYICSGQLNMNQIVPSIERFIGNNVSELNISGSSDINKALKYRFYFDFNEGRTINQQDCRLSTDLMDYTTVKTTQFISSIDYALQLSMQTNYLSGSIDEGGQIYSQNFIFQNALGYIKGYEKNWEIKDPSKRTMINLVQNTLYDKGYQFSGSFNILARGRTILDNVNINDYTEFRNYKDNDLMTFDYIQGQFYNKKLNSIVGNTESYFSASELRGIGQFYIKTSGSYISKSTNIIYYDKDEKVSLEESNWLFCGEGYNANINIQYINGKIYKSAFQHIDLQWNKIYYSDITNIKYNKLYINTPQIINLNLSNIDRLEVSIDNGIKTPENFILKLNNSNSLLQLKMNNDIHLEDNFNIDANFNLNQEQYNSNVYTFSGLYQALNSDLTNIAIQCYKLNACELLDYEIFNTEKVFYYNNDYTVLYIPIAIYSRNIDLTKLYNQLNQHKLNLKYSYYNEIEKPNIAGNSQVLPLKISISDIDLYSGLYNSVEVYYTNNPTYNNYQLLSIIDINENENLPIIREVDLPILGFSGETTNFLIKHKDALGRYAPEQFFNQLYNIRIDTEQILQLEKTYNITYIGESVASGVISINGLTGQVILRAQQIPFNDTTVYNALEYLFNRPTGLPEQIIVFQPSQIYSIGKYINDLTINWDVSDLVNVVQYHYTISQVNYPNETNFNIINTGILPAYADSLVITDTVSQSLKIDLQVLYNQTFKSTYTTYVWFRNYIYWGVCSNIDDIGWLINCVKNNGNKKLSNNYKNQCNLNVVQSNYIIYMFPLYMLADNNYPQFSVNGLIGGFIELYRTEILNENNYSETYVIFRSVNHSLGITRLEII